MSADKRDFTAIYAEVHDGLVAEALPANEDIPELVEDGVRLALIDYACRDLPRSGRGLRAELAERAQVHITDLRINDALGEHAPFYPPGWDEIDGPAALGLQRRRALGASYRTLARQTEQPYSRISGQLTVCRIAATNGWTDKLAKGANLFDGSPLRSVRTYILYAGGHRLEAWALTEVAELIWCAADAGDRIYAVRVCDPDERRLSGTQLCVLLAECANQTPSV